MHRATPLNTSFRAYTAGGAKSVVDEVDDGKLMQEMKGNGMRNQSHDKVESPQNYGFTSAVMPGDKDENGNLTMGAETTLNYMGGSNSLPIAGPMDDRRHRLKGLEKGDSAMYRTKDDRQQFHMATDSGEGDDKKPGGNFMSVRDDRVNRFALVPKPDDDKNKKQNESVLGQQQQQQAKKPPKATGQTNLLDLNRKSEVATEQNGKEIFHQHGQQFVSSRGGSDSSTYSQGSRKYSTQSTDKHTHIRWDDHRIFNDETGNWATSPILIKKDPHCKE